MKNNVTHQDIYVKVNIRFQMTYQHFKMCIALVVNIYSPQNLHTTDKSVYEFINQYIF